MATGLPEEMMINILLCLPVKSVLRFRCVCKTWRDLFKSPDFTRMHLNRSKENNQLNFMLSDGKEMYFVHNDESSLTESFDKAIQVHHPLKSSETSVQILAFCDGLFCLDKGYSKTSICLWNPCTGEYKEIPAPPPPIKFPNHLLAQTTEFRQMRIGEHRTSYGFGYDCNIKDYKLVRIVDLISHGSEVQVYTLGSNAWRSIAHIAYNIAYQEPHGILVNTTLHWSARKSSTQLHSIVSFHIESESFKEVPLPRAENFDDKHQISLCVSGRCLCILTHHHKVRTDVWVMKEYGVGHSWAKLVSITQQTILDSFYLMPVLFIKNDVVLLDQNYHSGLLCMTQNMKMLSLILTCKC
ncbi:F-box protein CPR1-like [Papaver somniferum]|uniref:F-box protein CPR1-like n=1 Tax=Papaver somniferum TaxID=3469 RepID=UPI000E6FDB88|nr:F-box protein CPR1-like [Papaver somniferum]XP_026442748.1 F-box protein CPR1-like [Papaver somniferum]